MIAGDHPGLGLGGKIHIKNGISTHPSIRRPFISSKLLRMPTRGALGNGLRVVAGVVLASGGRLVVATRVGEAPLA